MQRIKGALVTIAAVCAAAIGGGAIANAASSGSGTSSSTTGAAPPGVAPPGAPGRAAPQGEGSGAPSFDPSKGGHTVGGRTETLLTGETAAKVRAAALAKVPGTVQRVETNVDDDTRYEAHIAKSTGEQVVVEVNSDYSVASVKAMGRFPQAAPG